ncbi:MAG: gamma carbonic anhydrase family protein, partial [Tannerellaceae bacterium]
KKVDPEQAKEINQKIARNYHMYASWYKDEEDGSENKEQIII